MLAWQIEHQDKQAQYRRYEELTGELPAEAAAAPQLKSWNNWVWQAFTDLTGSRQWTMGGPAGIPFSEVKAWLEWQGIAGEEAEDLVHLLRELDNEYLKLSNKAKD